MLIALYLMLLHFIGDFVCQTNAMALGKSKKWGALLSHVATYTAIIYIGVGFNWTFAAITFVAHFATDAVTSRINSKLWFIELGEQYDTGRRDGVYFKKYHANVFPNRRHWFFVSIGADQLLHAAQLFLTAHWLGL